VHAVTREHDAGTDSLGIGAWRLFQYPKQNFVVGNGARHQ
jgi:hypothetical protein